MSDPKEYIVTVVVDGENTKATRIVHNGQTLMPKDELKDELKDFYGDDEKFEEENPQQNLQSKGNIYGQSNNSPETNNVNRDIMKNETTDFTTNKSQLNNNGKKGTSIPSARSITARSQQETDEQRSKPRNITEKIGSIIQNQEKKKWRGGKSRRSATRNNKKKTKTMRRKRRNL